MCFFAFVHDDLEHRQLLRRRLGIDARLDDLDAGLCELAHLRARQLLGLEVVRIGAARRDDARPLSSPFSTRRFSSMMPGTGPPPDISVV